MALSGSYRPIGFDYRRLRGALAEEGLTKKQLAEAAGLSDDWVCEVMLGRREPGELARIKLARAVKALDLDPEHVIKGPTAEGGE